MKGKKQVLMKKLNVCVGLVMTLHLDAQRSYQVKFCMLKSLISFIPFTRNQNMHVDLHEHGCKDKEKTEQAATDDICREIYRQKLYRGTISIALSILMHAVPRARSECFFCIVQAVFDSSCSTQLFGTKGS